MATEYIILAKDEKEGWKEIGTATGVSANAAIRERLNGAQQTAAYQGAGEYVAIPARSWRPVKVAVEQALKFS